MGTALFLGLRKGRQKGDNLLARKGKGTEYADWKLYPVSP